MNDANLQLIVWLVWSVWKVPFLWGPRDPLVTQSGAAERNGRFLRWQFKKTNKNYSSRSIFRDVFVKCVLDNQHYFSVLFWISALSVAMSGYEFGVGDDLNVGNQGRFQWVWRDNTLFIISGRNKCQTFGLYYSFIMVETWNFGTAPSILMKTPNTTNWKQYWS